MNVREHPIPYYGQDPGVLPPAPMVRRSAADLMRELDERTQDMDRLIQCVPDKVGVAVSTMIGHGGSLAAAIIDHFLGEKSNVGPVKINAALAAVMSFASAWTDSANVGEGLAAFSRGFGLPMTYIGMREWLAKRWPTDAPVKEKTA